ncbi:peptide ABC transporter permease [Limnohabitans sp. 2KL-1]|uniref:ABC transporter permease n=1 Tax=Limnohabitans sp. 2KL-1 TaxID=1100699 RepID=UPI000D3607BC|nr:FtsX-like permease family protein [Limnohabitans sp. 2KL-1]PUE50696.1 peptide ABC transporter permease [Limnohabitans sp. 2KL-1]
MNSLLSMARRSAWNRRSTLVWVVVSLSLATALLWTLERLRHDLRTSFSQSVSGVDLIVGARSSPVQLMLFSVFHIGSVPQSMSMDSVRALSQHRSVSWVVPLSLGDSHRAFPVLGTTPAYFQHFAYGDKQPLAWQLGGAFAGTLDGLYEAVIGAEVARKMGYGLGQNITLGHGLHEHDHDPDHQDGPAVDEHADKPFKVVGILAPTGTPVDRTVHVSLQALQALHLDWVAGTPMPGGKIPAEQARKFNLEPDAVTAALVGLKSRAAVFNVQRFVNQYEAEALMGVMPGVALGELWSVLGMGENALLAVSALVALVSVVSLMAVVLAGLNERRRELAVLRAVGAAPRHVLGLLTLEGLWVTGAGVLLGVLLAQAGMGLAAAWLQSALGIRLQIGGVLPSQLALMLAVLLAGLLASLGPAWRAYRLSLADGLSPRV